MGRPREKELGRFVAVGREISAARLRMGFASQDSLAVELGRSQKTISNWEAGLSAPDADELLVLQKVLELNPRVLGQMIARAANLVTGYVAPVVQRKSAVGWMRALAEGSVPKGEVDAYSIPRRHHTEGDLARIFWIEASGHGLVFSEPRSLPGKIEAGDLLLVEPGITLTLGDRALVMQEDHVGLKLWGASQTAILLVDPGTGKAEQPISRETFARRGSAYKVTLVQPAPWRI